MLSIAKVTNTAQAASYYNSPDKYYDKDNANIGSQWGGKGAEFLGLEGEVIPEDFIKMLEGRINPETHLGRVDKDGEIQHVPGWDFTFSAPKSLSILALVGEDKRLIDAHIEATQNAMKFIEANYAKTRIKKDNNTEYESVDNLIYASYVHTESRKHDPQLHSHNVVMNAVMDNNGQWRSLETLKMYEGKMMAGLVYRSSLAQLVKKIGYEIEVTDREKAFFDIKGVPESLMGDMSKRRKIIEETAKQRGLFDAESMAKVTLYSREAKTHVDSEELYQIWQSAVEESGVDLKAIIDASIERQMLKSATVTANIPTAEHGQAGRTDKTDPANQELLQQHDIATELDEDGYPDLQIKAGDILKPENDTLQATDKLINENMALGDSEERDLTSLVNDVRLAYRVLASDEAVFDSGKLVEEALKLTLGVAGPEDIDRVVNTMINTGELIPRSSRTDGGDLGFTTPEAFTKEKAMVGLMLQGKDERQAVGDTQGIIDFIAEFESVKSQQFGQPFAFSADQRNALVNAATSRDLVSGIQGYAGTGKTTLLECLIGYANTQGFTVKGFAPTGSATETLAKETGIEAKTIDSFLYTRRKDTVSQRELWLVDEASLVGASNMHDMLAEANRSGASMLLLGDTKQMEAVDWGRPFTVLQGFKMQTSSVTTIIRQKNAALLEAVQASTRNDFGLAFNKIRDNVFSLDRHSITRDYLNLSQEERDKSLVVIPDNESRMKFNSDVHDSRVKEGTLSANELEVKTLFSRNLNTAERTDSRYYKPKDIIEFQRDHGEFKAGEFGHVTLIDGPNLMVKTEDGKIRSFNPSEIPKNSKFAIDVFEQKSVRFSEGEKIAFSKSRKPLGVRNGDEYTLKNIDTGANTFTLVNNEGKEITLNSSDRHNLSHVYALTSYKAQGKTVDRVMVQLESWRRNLVNFRSFYVSLSRARLEARLYVDDVEKVKKALEKHDANKTTSLSGFSHGDMKRAAEQLSSQVDTKQLFADLNLAVQKLSLRQGVFSHTALMTETLKSTLGNYDVKDIEKAIYLQRNRGEIGLSHVNHDKPHAENFYTLPSNIRREAQIVKHMLQGKDRLAAIAGKSVISRYLDAHQEKVAEGHAEPVSEQTKEALINLLSSRDETVMITGSDHSGHREVMRTLGKTIAENSGYKVRGFSTSAEGVSQLKETIKSSANIYYHLDQMEKRVAASQRLPNARELWVVENVSQLGTDDLLRLQQVARYAGARMVLVADRQENSLSWGNVPTLLAEQGINTVNFEHATAALNPDINDATDKLSQGKVTEALGIISPMISEVRDEHDAANDKNVRLAVMAGSYINLAPEDREKTAVVVPNYFARNKVNEQIREGLQQQGILKGTELKTSLYSNANLDPFQKKEATSYRVGQVLQFESNRPGIEKGESYRIEGINKNTNELELTSLTNGNRLTFSADAIAGSRNNSVQVFHVNEKNLQQGEKIRFTRSTPGDKLINGDGKSIPSKTNGVIEHIDGSHIKVMLSSGRQVIVDTEQWKHIEYGYTQSLYNVKDKRFENVITIMESGKKLFSSQETLHNALTKASLNLRIITDSKAKLLEGLQSNKGFRQTALQNKQVSIDKHELASFDKQFGMGLSSASRNMLRMEAAVDKAVGITKTAIVEKAKIISTKMQQVTRQRSL